MKLGDKVKIRPDYYPNNSNPDKTYVIMDFTNECFKLDDCCWYYEDDLVLVEDDKQAKEVITKADLYLNKDKLYKISFLIPEDKLQVAVKYISDTFDQIIQIEKPSSM